MALDIICGHINKGAVEEVAHYDITHNASGVASHVKVLDDEGVYVSLYDVLWGQKIMTRSEFQHYAIRLRAELGRMLMTSQLRDDEMSNGAMLESVLVKMIKAVQENKEIEIILFHE